MLYYIQMGTTRCSEMYTYTQCIFYRKRRQRNLSEMLLQLVYLTIWAQEAMWMCVSSQKTKWIILDLLTRLILKDRGKFLMEIIIYPSNLLGTCQALKKLISWLSGLHFQKQMRLGSDIFFLFFFINKGCSILFLF